MKLMRKEADVRSCTLVGACLMVLFFALSLPASSFADGMEGQPSSQLKNAKGKVFSGSAGKAPVRKVGKTGNTQAIDDFELAKYQYCGADSDCLVSLNGCCDCANGGTEVAVNKDRLDAFRGRFDCLHIECTQKIAQPACGTGVVSCINHRCRYFDDRQATPSGGTATTP